MAELVTCGECLVDMVPDANGCFCPHPGGAPANVAVDASRLGLSAAFVGKRGDDAFGEILQAYLADGGVDTSGFTVTREALTALAFIQYRDGQVPEFSFYRSPGADELLRPQDFPPRLLDGAKAFHFGSISLYSEPAAGATRAAADKVRAHGGLVSYDPNLRPALMNTRPGALEAARSAIGRAHILKASGEELAQLTGLAREDQALTYLFEHGVRLVAITRGPDGATLTTSAVRVDLASEPVAVVDTTGAGDAFTAALVTGVLERGLEPPDLEALDRETLHALCQWANRVAALATTRTGATRGIQRP
ncbi:carbohydrate kinase family protein [Thiohalorhabdus sp. Cl-TMA]|uniref:Carbohydrate kinase n=1 Tax=Thiohalorhabdus methylotrophus TaxID=3242694 RepID=A0ABV4TXS7_9GAMM